MPFHVSNLQMDPMRLILDDHTEVALGGNGDVDIHSGIAGILYADIFIDNDPTVFSYARQGDWPFANGAQLHATYGGNQTCSVMTEHQPLVERVYPRGPVGVFAGDIP